jgi:hypothetical protein
MSNSLSFFNRVNLLCGNLLQNKYALGYRIAKAEEVSVSQFSVVEELIKILTNQVTRSSGFAQMIL